ncbi:Asp-tRNA(Asn)/Glu-tRNA(Gln) amidotransferase subunit GatA [Fervidibacter sacchari]|uniref:Glutamyl-tRNA(Gln) amidotransferase subunit A n=1 Tax=Candidatus Fervidibacter sacchari TaxID=1448929 RepID=A0ABT2EQC4_9BACT|nr:Asp-tRNA(Asn)/Glu-tRNA(Gln) amidotransferase subunit GatA [Candidatus Fervidibacter sacchari]MCS3920055.1 aspartyl-tRNA(Asn)/glutamyl-tRNA(Gln) amidotransferase subunit A [Candidatus Fervidibacter sacchari]WKU16714.1 Asp-tRNA(Asn)/Glu-tRNA(Gln) amidotransferase subunit GatA [Candidatus Fervidibacter sacchari]
MSLWRLTVHEAHQLLKQREISAVELTRAVLERISQVEDKVKAFLTITDDIALKMAEEADRRIAAGENVTPLTGIPIAIKDNMCTRGIRTTCASKILYNFIPPYDATVVAKLKEAGAVFVGKTNMDEFAMGSSTEFSGFYPTRNPWDLERVPGGSSGGSATAVAAGECLAALGSDTGGSIRQPAAFCGIVGMKPTYGRVSRYGLIAFASSLDQIGPMTRDVTDCALLLNAIAGHDPKDSTSIPQPVPDYTQALVADVKGMRIGLPREYFGEGIDPKVAEIVRKAAEQLAEHGAKIVELSLPTTEYALAAYYIIAPAEASSNLARYDGVQYGYRAPVSEDIVAMYSKTRSEGFGHEVKHRIMLGTYTLSAGYYEAYYLRAAKVRTLIRRDFERAFQQCDVLLTPTSPVPPFKLGERTDDPLLMKMSDICTIPANMAGLPAISVPCGFLDGLPIGVQFIGKVLDEMTLIRVAYTYEQISGYRNLLAEL